MMRVTQLLRAAMQRHPEAIAVQSSEGSWSWAQFTGRVARLAAVLAARGIAPGDRVAILAENSHRYLECFYGVPWAGAILVPLNTRLAAVNLAEMLAQSGAALVLHDAACARLWQATSALQPSPMDMIDLDDPTGYEALLAAHGPLEDRSHGGDQTATLFFTGGTTGRPKGVMMSHANHVVNSLALWAAVPADPKLVRYLHVAPMFHVADALFVHAITTLGGRHCILPAFDAAATLRALAAQSVTDLILVPTMIRALLDVPDMSAYDVSALKRLHYGAAPMPQALAAAIAAAWPHVGLVQLYGQTEAGPVITILDPESHRSTAMGGAHARSAGRPLPGVEIAIAAPDGTLLAQGEVGEVVVRSGGVMTGYWQDEPQTAAALRDGWLHTGDGGSIDAFGFLTISDRLKDMIISGGENIYSIEVEQALAFHPAVSQCAVIGLPDPVWGERVHAVVVLAEGAACDETALLTHCRTRLARFKCPRSFDLRTGALPISGAGKILKRTLRDEAIAREAVLF